MLLLFVGAAYTLGIMVSTYGNSLCTDLPVEPDVYYVTNRCNIINNTYTLVYVENNKVTFATCLDPRCMMCTYLTYPLDRCVNRKAYQHIEFPSSHISYYKYFYYSTLGPFCNYGTLTHALIYNNRDRCINIGLGSVKYVCDNHNHVVGHTYTDIDCLDEQSKYDYGHMCLQYDIQLYSTVTCFELYNIYPIYIHEHSKSSQER